NSVQGQLFKQHRQIFRYTLPREKYRDIVQIVPLAVLKLIIIPVSMILGRFYLFRVREMVTRTDDDEFNMWIHPGTSELGERMNEQFEEMCEMKKQDMVKLVGVEEQNSILNDDVFQDFENINECETAKIFENKPRNLSKIAKKNTLIKEKKSQSPKIKKNAEKIKAPRMSRDVNKLDISEQSESEKSNDLSFRSEYDSETANELLASQMIAT
ncbi:hypothetical protein HK096_008764, partial [Nowakowskiella sp. JEL0078]